MIKATYSSKRVTIEMGSEAYIELEKPKMFARTIQGTVARNFISFEPDSSLNFNYNIYYDGNFRGTLESNWLGKTTIHVLDDNNNVRKWKIKNRGTWAKLFEMVDTNNFVLVRLNPITKLNPLNKEFTVDITNPDLSLAEAVELCLFCVMGARQYSIVISGGAMA